MNSVQVLCPNGRRVNIKVLPNSPLLSVLEDACRKQGFDPRQHALKHQRKILDVSQMFRYSGLPNNAKLELVTSSHCQPRKEQPVRVAVQLQSGDRLQGVFPPTVSLWDLMCSLHGNSGWMAGEAMIVYMRREVCGEDKLKGTSLKDLGVDCGSVVLRLIHRQQQQDQQPMDTTSSSIDNSSNDIIMGHSDSHDPGSHDTTTTNDLVDTRNPVATGSHGPTTTVATGSHDPVAITSAMTSSLITDSIILGSHDSVAPSSHDQVVSESHQVASSHATVSVTPGSHDPVDPNSHDATQVVTGSHDATSTISLTTGSHDPTTDSHELTALATHSSASNTTGQNEGLCDRQVVVFNMADYTSDATPITELPDSFFDVTVDDCAAMQRDLQQRVKKMTDAPLVTGSLRQAALHERYSRYNKAIVRIQFPDHWVLQGSFQPHELLRALVLFVREHLANPAVKFYLYTTPPKMILTNAKLTLVQAGLVPASVVHLGLHDNKDKEFLKTSLLEQAVSPLQADVIAMTTRDKTLHNSQLPMETTSSDIVQTNATHYTQHQEIVNRGTNTAVNKTTKAVPKWFKHSGGKKL